MSVADDNLRIRPATEADLPAVLALLAQPDMDGAALSPAQALPIFHAMQRIPDYVLYVGESGGETVATFALLIVPNLGECGMPSALIEDIAVAPTHQGRGIGRALIAEALRLCAGKGCYKLSLSSHTRRRRAHAFYEGLGFERHGYSFVIEPPRPE